MLEIVRLANSFKLIVSIAGVNVVSADFVHLGGSVFERFRLVVLSSVISCTLRLRTPRRKRYLSFLVVSFGTAIWVLCFVAACAIPWMIIPNEDRVSGRMPSASHSMSIDRRSIVSRFVRFLFACICFDAGRQFG